MFLVIHFNHVYYLVLNNLSDLAPWMKMKMLRAKYICLEINPVMKLKTLRRLEGRHVDQFSVSRNVLVSFTCNWASFSGLATKRESPGLKLST